MDAAGPPVALAPHAPSFAREYTKTLICGVDGAKSKVAWYVPGTVWLWTTRPDLIKVPPRLDIDSVAGTLPGWPGGKICLEFTAQKKPGFVTADVHLSAAPPEFSNARRYLLRFHLTYVESQVAAHKLAEQRVAEDLKVEQLRIKQLETMVNTERLIQLEKECARLHEGKLRTTEALGPHGDEPTVPYAHGVPQLGVPGFAPPWAYGLQQQQQQQQGQDHHREALCPDHEHFVSLQDQLAQLNDHLHSTMVPHAGQSPSRAGSPPRRLRTKKPTVAMEDGWFASYDWNYACPYYFHPNSAEVRWEPPPGQRAVLVSHGTRPRSSTRKSAPSSSFGSPHRRPHHHSRSLDEND